MFLQTTEGESRWYDALPGEPMYLDNEAEDVLEAEALLDDLDKQRQVKLRVIREQEACLSYELGLGEGLATKDWLVRAYAQLGEMEAQMFRLQCEQTQRIGLAPLQMAPSLAAVRTCSNASPGEPEVDGTQTPEQEILHTHTVPLSEVVRDLSGWHHALLDEFNSILTTHKAIRPVSREELRAFEKQGRQVLYVPGKLVATVKAGTGKRKARVLACGNFLSREKPQGSPTLSRGDIFAAGLDSLALRAQAAAASWRGWSGGTVDIRTAFLTAPLQSKRSQRVVVLRPPKVLITAGIVPEGSLYLIEKALYGLAESPQDWSAERDSRLKTLEFKTANKSTFGLEQTKADHSIWRIRETKGGDFVGPTRGLLGVYVDDLLVTAETPLLEGLMEKITTMWRCSNPQMLEEEVVAGEYLLCQSKYIRELQQRHAEIRESRTLPSFRDKEPAEETPSLLDVREAQRYLGELQWLACRSRPDISFSVSRASRLVAKNPKFAIKAAKQILAYLFHTVDLKLRYGNVPTHHELAPELPYERSVGLVEAFSDASFGCEDGRSQSGVAVLLGGCLVAWLSVPQPFTTLSTCESELVSACEALTLSQAIIPLWRELVEVETKWVVITDSVSAASVLLYPSGSWRTRHLRLRCRVYQELIEEEVLTLAHVKGQYQVADLLTKALSPQKIKQLLDYLGCVDGNEAKAEETQPIQSRKASVTGQAGTEGITKSLQVLSLLVSPVNAQPFRDEGLGVGSRLWLWIVVFFGLCVLLGWCLLVGRLREVERLRALSRKGLEATEGISDKGESMDRGQIRPEDTSVQGCSSGPSVAIRAARSTVGQPPPLPFARKGEAKPQPPKAIPFPLRKPKAPPLKVKFPSLPAQSPRAESAPQPKISSVKPPPPKAKPPPFVAPEAPTQKAKFHPLPAQSPKAESIPPVQPSDLPKGPPVKRPPLLPRFRFHDRYDGEIPELPIAAVSKASSSNDGMKVHTPPRQVSTELPPLLSYEELIQRAMRRELQREPTWEEVEEEIRQMGIRNAIQATEGSVSESYESDYDSSSMDASETHIGDNVGQPISGSQFEYLPPEPVPILRLVSPQGSDVEGQGTVWSAVRVDGGRIEPTTVIAGEVPSGSTDMPNMSFVSYVDDHVSPPEDAGLSVSSANMASQQREYEALFESQAIAFSASS